MPALPALSDFTGTSRTNAQMRVTHGALHAYLTGLLGGDGAPATALATLGAMGAAGHLTRSAATVLAVADRGKVVTATAGSWTLTLPDAASAGAGWSVILRNAGSGTVTVSRAGSDLIDGATTAALPAGAGMLVIGTGTGWIAEMTAQGAAAGRALRTADLVSSASDTTAGRVATVGWMGLGGNVISYNNTADLNALPNVFSHLIGNSSILNVPANLPASGQAFAGWQVRLTSTRTLQMLADLSSSAGGLWWRRNNSGWMPWRRVYDTVNVVGTVAQSGGVPSGAVIERGANANGEFLRLADGTQLCWRTLTGSTGAASTWTFPAAFVAAPVVTGTAVATALSAVCLDAAPGATAATVSARDGAGARRADVMHLTACGRWF